MKHQIEVFLPSQEEWLAFYKPFDTKEAAEKHLKTSVAVLISGDFKFRIVGVY